MLVTHVVIWPHTLTLSNNFIVHVNLLNKIRFIASTRVQQRTVTITKMKEHKNSE